MEITEYGQEKDEQKKTKKRRASSKPHGQQEYVLGVFLWVGGNDMYSWGGRD